MKQIHQLYKIIKPTQKGVAKIDHIEVDRTESLISYLRSCINPHRPSEYCPSGEYVRLVVNGKLYMSNTLMEQITNREIIQRAHGHTLIAGLGIGMILFPILAKKELTKITVVEKYADVIELIKPYFRSRKLKIINADIFEWRPKDEKFNVIYNDIWPDANTDNLKEIAILHQRQKFWLDRNDPNCWLGSWCQDYLRNQQKFNRI